MSSRNNRILILIITPLLLIVVITFFVIRAREERQPAISITYDSASSTVGVTSRGFEAQTMHYAILDSDLNCSVLPKSDYDQTIIDGTIDVVDYPNFYVCIKAQTADNQIIYSAAYKINAQD